MVTKYTDILSEELYVELMEYINKLIKDRSNRFSTSTLIWKEYLKGNSAPISRYDFLEETDAVIVSKVGKEVEHKTGYLIEGFCLHLWPNLSYITWHNDGHVKAALTLYLNENWDKNWGGFLMYEDTTDNTIKAIKPEKNMGLLQENSVVHSVTTINIGADVRISLQFFLKEKSKKIKTLL
jgi:Rps23 Pro-64 3,4-dihydroxylase Tpa1-like proline 4-hydroxylase